MTIYGLLFDYEYCTNCKSCIVSCKEEHDYGLGQDGIKVVEQGPWKIGDDEWNYDFFPLPTDLCDLCADRTERGKEPICVHHCLSNIISYGPIEELAKKMAGKPKQMLVTPQFRPKQARGAFVHKANKVDEHHSAHIKVEGTGTASFGAHRHDAKVGEFDDTESIEEFNEEVEEEAQHKE